jgi:mono/diheme cytochrome c family protein
MTSQNKWEQKMEKGKFLDLHRHLPSATFVSLAALVIAAFAGAFIFAGVYNIGADAPHYRPIYMALEQLRDRAITHHARNIVVPADLNSPARIATGAGLYTEMCTGCHLGPGLEKTEMSQGLYPQAPELARGEGRSAAEQFWTIKHGVKLSAMPAWGRTHDDQLIWDMVAFVRALPKMTPDQYKAAIASAPADHDAMMKDMPGMKSMGEMKPEGKALEAPAPAPTKGISQPEGHLHSH